MSPLIDRSYFEGALVLPVDSDVNRAALDAAIAEWQPKYLQRVLGPSLAAAFEVGLQPTGGAFSSGFSAGFDIGRVAERWLWLRDGHAYSYGGRRHIWPGLTVAKESPLANYVYFNYRRDTVTANVGVGELLPATENGTVVNPSYKLKRAWDQMADWNRALWGLVSTQTAIADAPLYPELVSAEVDRSLFEYCFSW